MDFSNLTALTPNPEAEAPLITKTIKKNQLPACDTFGPFPDETVLSGIDRLLFLMGAQRLQRLMNMPSPCFDMVPSDASINVEEPPESARTCCTIITTESSGCSCPSRKVSVRKCCCPKCSDRSSARVKIVELERNEKPSTPRKSFQPLKRSFSLCSLACRKLRQVCFLPCKNQCPGSTNAGSLGGMGCGKLSAPKWIWTRMFSHPSGCEIYEVFKNSCTCTHPSQIKIKSSPKLIFVVLPNGLVMPFETISCH